MRVGLEWHDNSDCDMVYTYKVKRGKVREFPLKTNSDGTRQVKIVPISDFALIRAEKANSGKPVSFMVVGLKRNKMPKQRGFLNL